MDSNEVLGIFGQAMVSLIAIAGPIVAVTIVVGVLISIVQAATQIQEPTLSFAPKAIAIGAVLALLGPWMLGQLAALTRYAMDLAVQAVR
jgi:flagellar biosynthetic protein FliQ